MENFEVWISVNRLGCTCGLLCQVFPLNREDLMFLRENLIRFKLVPHIAVVPVKYPITCYRSFLLHSSTRCKKWNNCQVHAVAIAIHRSQFIAESRVDIVLALLCSAMDIRRPSVTACAQHWYSHLAPWLMWLHSMWKFLPSAEIVHLPALVISPRCILLQTLYRFWVGLNGLEFLSLSFNQGLIWYREDGMMDNDRYTP